MSGEPARNEVEERVLAQVDRLQERLIATVQGAVRIASVNPKYPGVSFDELIGRESEVAHLVADVYREAGATVEIVTAERGRDNAVGLVEGAGDGRSLIFNGHVDVVPGGEPSEWTHGEPFGAQLHDGWIWGRGAADMKAGVLAQAFAALAVREAGVRLAGPLILEAVVGEELGDHQAGTSAVIAAGYVADAAVVAEPSAPPVALGINPVAPGLLVFEVEIVGRSAHIGMRGPTLHPTMEGAAGGVNAVDKGLLVLEATRRLEQAWAETDRHPLYPAGQFGICPAVVSAQPRGLQVPFLLADEMRIAYCALHHPERPAAEVRAEIEAAIAAAGQTDPWLRAHPPRVEWTMEWPALRTAVDAPICREMARAHERAAAGTALGGASIHGSAGVSDATWLQAAGIPSICYGPGDFKRIHAVDEAVAVDEVAMACRAFALLLLEWCGVASA